MKIKVTVEVDVPEGATHYAGEILDDPTYWRPKERSDGLYWQYWCETRHSWMFSGINKPHWISLLSEVK